MSADDSTKLRRSKGRNGQALRGLWECDIVRMERRDEWGWAAEVPLRPIGRTKYREFATGVRGGAWTSIGHYRTRNGALQAAKRLQSGLSVWEPGASAAEGVMRNWAEVAEEIAADPWVRGQSN